MATGRAFDQASELWTERKRERGRWGTRELFRRGKEVCEGRRQTDRQEQTIGASSSWWALLCFPQGTSYLRPAALAPSSRESSRSTPEAGITLCSPAPPCTTTGYMYGHSEPVAPSTVGTLCHSKRLLWQQKKCQQDAWSEMGVGKCD